MIDFVFNFISFLKIFLVKCNFEGWRIILGVGLKLLDNGVGFVIVFVDICEFE